MIKKTDTMNNEHLLSSINTYKNKEIKSILQFARLLYDNYYEYLNIHDENGKKIFDDNATYTGAKNNDYRFAVDIVRKEVAKDLRAPDCRNSKYLYAYCLCFGCSADYLLGFIDFPTKAKTDFYEMTGLWDNCIDTLSECNKHKSFDNSFADYNQNIILLLNYLLYQGKDKFVNYDKITLLNDIFNYLVFSDFDSYTDNKGIPQGSHISFTDKNGRILCSLPASNMCNAIKLNINSTLDTLKKHIKDTGCIMLEKPPLKELLNEIKENQDKINEYDIELDNILESANPKEKKDYIGTLERCKGLCFEQIHVAESNIVFNYKDMLKKKNFSDFLKWQQELFEKLYVENEYYIMDKI